MGTAAGLASGLVITLVVGEWVGQWLKQLRDSRGQIPVPSASTAERWKHLAENQDRSAGRVLGLLERLLFFAAFSARAPEIVGGWLAFKVASKWNVWDTIVAVPDTLPGADPLDYLAARLDWASRQLMGFLIGTILNVLIAYVAHLVFRGIEKALH